MAEAILAEIADPAMTRHDVAITYRLILLSSDTIDWATINRAIIKRWSLRGLSWIKTAAWTGKGLRL